ncbi:efflux RND transporter periplasmic adaptor subunit [Maledivibacter halophilus]|uniref:RND family efflux transporter, MFP subunit n=1 Tax=Maledivibacter halophilus TaxID=36842 RepID=A0A1T5MAG1_9FIRM|nr:efflux RND transporter periplasmic adaptor subunit [Maledivibacter halophilus]SKC85212.1 RND family efflux transporter, MFP subunit [Maledivibacter halophilus]
MKRKALKIITIIFITLVLIFTFFSKTIYNYSLPEVSTKMPSKGNIVNTIRAKGLIKPKKVHKIYSDYEGKVMNVYFDKDDEVKVGNTILKLEDDNTESSTLLLEIDKMNNNLSLLQNKAEKLKESLEKNTVLFKQKAIIKSELDNIREEYDKVLADIENVKIDMDLKKKELSKQGDKSIIADKSGIIHLKNVDEGQYINKNHVIYEIYEKSNTYEVDFHVCEEESLLLSVGDVVEVALFGNKNKIEGTISSITYDNEDEDNEFKIKISFDYTGKESIIGKPVEITIKIVSQPFEALVPNSAIKQDVKGYYVLVIGETDGIFGKEYYAKKINVRVIKSDEKNSAVEGFTYFRPVIIGSDKEIKNGSRVKICQQ